MKSTWFISDTHFSHANIIRFSKRPFSEVEAHDEQLVANWNAAVQKGDDVFFLGDLVFGKKDHALALRQKLVGNIHFVEGNHDTAAHQIRDTLVSRCEND